jgi:glycerol-3-phosphate acyltransferase PlsY
MVFKFLLVIAIGYLLGSIPFGLIMGKFKAKVDIRNYGSGRTGGTNVLRTLGRRAFLAVAALDLLKGTAAVLLAGLIVNSGYIQIGLYDMGRPAAMSLAAMAAVCGHIWPVFAKFRGGRGVGTFIGTMFAISPVSALFGGEIIIIGAGLSGFASLGSLAGVVGAYTMMIPLTFLYGFPMEFLFYAMAGSILIAVMHRDNIVRLFNGKERKLNQKADVRTGSPA